MFVNPSSLSTIRALAGLSQAELARRSGVSQGRISEIEAVEPPAWCRVTPQTARRLADALGCALSAVASPSAPLAAAS